MQIPEFFITSWKRSVAGLGPGETLLLIGMAGAAIIGLLLMTRAWRDTDGLGGLGEVSQEWRAQQRTKGGID
jgi:hypothetical protein